ncbi:glycosyltransferase family 4 protein [Methanomethylovorans sp.]|uniref:glycosyltransferase family 4 protein n=1 Tax=Methanomethylovorans sp. TaxID=2758717 RepID=UPI002FDD097D
MRSSVCIVAGVSYAHLSGTSILISNITDIFRELDKRMYFISDNYTKEHLPSSDNIHFIVLSVKSQDNIFLKIMSIVRAQLEISFKILSVSRKVDSGFFFVSGTLFLPIIICRTLRKEAVLVNPASEYSRTKLMYQKNSFLKRTFPVIVKLMEDITQISSSKIILSSPSLSSYLSLSKYSSKIVYAPGEYVQLDKFMLKKAFDHRDNMVGYVGRLSEEKGILNFIESIPIILGKRSDLKFLIIGDGPLKESINIFLREHNLQAQVDILGWIPHDKLPFYLNQLKILVLPSYTEGLPNIVLESMACGTPVLATPVGSIPDLIENDRTGFILKDNSPYSIADKIIESLNNDHLAAISGEAINHVVKEYSFESVVQKYSQIFSLSSL